MKLKILKYNKNKAIGKFILFKFLELFAIFLFTFGFESLGRVTYERFDLWGFSPVTYIGFWFYGLLSLLLAFWILVVASVLIFLIIYLIISWVKLNWRWAKISAEDEGSKIERLSEQKKLKAIRKIEMQEEQRKEHGYCVGDTAVRIKGGTFGKVGDKFEIICVNPGGGFDCLNGPDREVGIPKNKFKMIKNKLSKKPKLNNVREKEINDRKKKE